MSQTLDTEKEKLKSKDGNIEKKEFKIFLIPEFVSLTGMSDEQRQNHNVMKSIAPFTKLRPDERVEKNEKIIAALNKSKEINIGDAKIMNAYQLPEPRVQLNSRVFPSDNGSLNFKDRVLKGVKFNDWTVVYSRRNKYDDEDADDLYRLINKASDAFGITFQAPGWIVTDSNINSWKQEILADVEKNGKPQIIVLFLQRNEERFYG